MPNKKIPLVSRTCIENSRRNRGSEHRFNLVIKGVLTLLLKELKS